MRYTVKSIFNVDVNRRFFYTRAYVMTLTMMLLCGAAMGQRTETPPSVTVGGSVFGGGNKALVAGNTSVLLDQQGATITKDVYGGGALANVGTDNTNTTTVDILNGIVEGNVYGGGLGDSIVENHVLYQGTQNIAALVYGKVYVNVGDSSLDASHNVVLEGKATIRGSVFGCNNINGTPLDSVFVNIYKTAHTGIEGNTYPMTTGTVTLNDLGTELSVDRFAIKAVYGGGNMASYKPQMNTGNTRKCTTVHVWGCEENTIQTIYGGGNAANVGTADKPADTRLILDGGRHDRVFGGGNGYSSTDNHDDPSAAYYNPGANIYGTASTTINGGLYRQVFGGSNQYGDLNEVALVIDNVCDTLLIFESFGGANEAEITADVETTLLCSDYVIGNFYGGSNKADINGDVTLNVRGGTYSNVFGGSKGTTPTANTPEAIAAASADISGDVTLNLHGGTIGSAYGGSDVFGNITGCIKVNVSDTVEYCHLQIDTIYGGGRDAAYKPSLATLVSPVVSILNDTIGTAEGRGCVFGGGKGSSAVVYANPKVIIGIASATDSTAWVKGNVYGGGNAARVDGIDSVLMVKYDSRVDTIFGGGNQAGSNGAIIRLFDGHVYKGIYGGCNTSGTISGDIVVDVLGGTVGTEEAHANIHGGGYGQETQTQGHVAVNFGEIAYDGSDNEIHTSYPLVYGDIYGGSALGSINASNGVDTTMVNILNGEVKKTTSGTIVGGNVYGGGLGRKPVGETPGIAALVNGKVFVNIGDTVVSSGTVTYRGKAVVEGNVFGCNNLNGSPQDSVFVNVFQTHHGTDPATNAYPTEITTLQALATNSQTQTYAIQAVYGGGNEAAYTPALAGSEPRSTTVHIFDCQSNTVKEVYGGGNAANVGTTGEDAVSANTFVVIDGGRINRVFGGGKGVTGSGAVAANIYGTATTTINAGLIDTIFGGSNMNGNIDSISLILAHDPTTCTEIFNQVYGGANLAALMGDLSTTITCGVETVGDIYGGSNLANINGNVELNIRGGQFTNVFGGSKGASGTGNGADISGDVTLNLEGGTMVNAFGGSNVQGNIGGYITVNVLDTVTGCGLQVDTIYGGGQDAAYTPNTVAGKKIVSPVVNLLKGTVGERSVGSVTAAGCVFGGGKGSSAVVTAHPKVVVGDTIAAHSGYVATVLGNVFGGGNAASVDGIDSVLMLKSNSQVVNLFGGGNVAAADSTVVWMTNGTVDTIFGGGNEANLNGTALVALSGGTVNKGVYGGCNTSGTVNDDITVSVTGGTVGASGTGNGANVHGGGYGNQTNTKGDVDVTINGASAVIWGDVYGGSAKGHVNDAAADKTNVTLEHGTIHGDLYGGGLGVAGTYAAKVNGAVQVTVNGGTVTGSVYGCNNANGAPQSSVHVDIYGTDLPASGCALANVFGGGNEAAYGGTPVVTIHNCDNSIGFVYGGGNKAKVAATDVTVYGSDTIGYVFGGGNGQGVAADFEMVSGNVNAKIRGGKITHVFGGNNTSGKITGSVTLNVDKQTESVSASSCDMKIGEVYGGGNLAAGNAGTITIGCTGTWTTGDGYTHEHHNDTDNRIGYELEGIGTVYGGANQADVNNGIDLTIVSGIVENVFGGNNTWGSVGDTIRVTINKTGDCDWYVGNVYGGGNLAQYSAPSGKPNYPKVRVLNGTVSEDVFGGGLGNTGDAGKVTGNPQVTVNGAGAAVNGGVYGGGSLAPTQGNPLVTQTLGATAKVFGGGKAASLTGAPIVNINGGTVSTGVYGGCDSQGNVSGDIIVNITNGTIGSQDNLNQTTPVTADVYGGGYGESTSTSGNVEVNIGTLSNTHSEFPKIYGDVYGGSALGNVNDAASDNTTVNIYNGTLATKTDTIRPTSSTYYVNYYGGNVFGGGLGRKADGALSAVEAKVLGTVTVNIGAPARSGRTLNPDDDENQGMATIQGNIYGCNNTNGSPQDSVTVHVYRTYRSDDEQINYAGNDPKYAIANVFGGGNQANYVPLSTASHKKLKVMIHGCYNSVRRVFGGSNAAASGSSSISTTVSTNIDGGRFYQVFGGGNGEVSAANIYGDLDLQIHGGIVGQFYGASNQNGTITGNINTVVDNTSGCQSIQITEYFCGGNYANVYGDLVSTITCSEGMEVTSLYGGCNQANIYGDVVLNLYGGKFTNVFGGSKGVANGISADILAVTQEVIDDHPDLVLTLDHGGSVTLNLFGGTIENVFGGSNINGKIQHEITVNVMDDGGDCPLYITNLYGGSNMTNYEPDSVIVNENKVSIVSPVVNVMNIYSNITGSVYGGSKGVQGADVTVKANPRVNIGYEADMEPYIPHDSNGQNVYTIPSSPKTTIQGSVFGGGDAAKVEGNTEIFLNKHAKVIGNVYGGGNMGEVQGDTKVIVNGKRQ